VIRSTFFRQSAWMLFASLAGGGLLALVHRIAGKMDVSGEYGLFTTILNSVQALTFPSLGLAAVFTQMTAAATTEEARRDVASAARRAAGGMFVYWIAICLLIFAGKGWLMTKYRIENPLPLLWLAPTLLITLVSPISLGIVQGRQDFLWAGLGAILGGAGRLAITWLAVALIGASAGWAICGVFFGLVAGFVPLLLASRPIWSLTGGAFRFGHWMRDALPLTAGLTASAFLFSLDQWGAREFLTKADNDLYAAAGVVGRVVMWVAAPLVIVMFPKVVGAAATADNRRILFQAMAATLFVAGMAALACTLFPSVPLLALQGKVFADKAAPLVPVYVWCLLPLTLANVLLTNLLARKHYRVVVPLALVVAGYWLALRHFNRSPKEIILTLGAASLAALLVCVAATWLEAGRGPKQPA
jgi:O-antigen/teichoic acid export membrane protein